MKFRSKIAAAALAIAAPGAAMAATTPGTLTVKANVQSSCIISADADNVLDFGNIDPLNSQTDATGTFKVTCSLATDWTAGGGNGANYTDAGNHRAMKNGTSYLKYDLYLGAPATAARWGTAAGQVFSGTGTGSAQTVTVNGRVVAGQTSVATGAYLDTVAITVSY